MNTELVEKATAVAPLLREHARDAEQARQAPEATVKDYIESGALKTIHPFDVAMFPEQAQKDVWGENADQIVVSGVAPSGKGERTDGGAIAIGWDRCGATYGRVALGLEPGPDEI